MTKFYKQKTDWGKRVGGEEWEEGVCDYKRATQEILVVMELYYILTMVADVIKLYRTKYIHMYICVSRSKTVEITVK